MTKEFDFHNKYIPISQLRIKQRLEKQIGNRDGIVLFLFNQEK